jgi:pimeloyl-ACP methyl ester carboxylesterase
VDGTFMVPSAMGLCTHYHELALPVTIMAGDGDKIVSYRLAERLQAAINGSTLQIIEGGGHTVHHIAPDQTAEAILEVARKSGGPAAS